MKSNLAHLLIVGASLLGCASSADVGEGEKTGTARLTIVGGWDATWSSAVVALVDDSGGVRCSGTLVSPRAVVTAAHCKGAGATNVLFGQSPTAPDAVLVPIAAFVAHPDFDAHTLAADIAVLSLAKPPPPGVVPAEMSADPLTAAMVGQHVAVIGYGLDQPGGTVGRRGGRALVADVAPTLFHSVPDPSQPCRGDSGGPALVDTEQATIVIGVISSGDSQCVDHTSYTSLVAFRASFVDPLVTAMADGATTIGDCCYHASNCDGENVCRPAAAGASVNVCTHACVDDSTCPASMHCAAGFCAPPLPPGSRGAVCVADSDCDSGLCSANHNAAVCVDACIPDVLPCGEGYGCMPLRPGEERSACFPVAAPLPTASTIASTAATASAASAPAPESAQTHGCSATPRLSSGSDDVRGWLALLLVATVGRHLSRSRRRRLD